MEITTKEKQQKKGTVRSEVHCILDRVNSNGLT